MKLLPSMKQLQYLTALDETRHFAKAAQRCNITASTLSAGIRDLEQILEVSVAERTKRSVLMTPIGVEFARRARLILSQAEEMMALAAANLAPMCGDMHLGVIPTISPFLLPRVLPALRKQYPELNLYLREEQTEPVLAQLRAGDLDAALLALPYDIDGLRSRTLMDDEFLVACSAGHEFAKQQSVPLSRLADTPLLLLEEGHCLRGHALAACQLADRDLRNQFEATSLHTLVQMVAAGMGVTLIPKLAADAHIAKGTRIALRPLEPAAFRSIGLVWRSGSPRESEFELLADALMLPAP